MLNAFEEKENAFKAMELASKINRWDLFSFYKTKYFNLISNSVDQSGSRGLNMTPGPSQVMTAPSNHTPSVPMTPGPSVSTPHSPQVLHDAQQYDGHDVHEPYVKSQIDNYLGYINKSCKDGNFENKLFSFYAVNLRSFNNKKITVQDILFKNNIDFAVLSEINCQSVPILKNYKQFVVYSKRRFHGVSVCVKSSLVKHCIRIPHPDENQFEIVHIRINDTSVPTNLLGVYLDVESRSNVDAVKEGWFKLLNIAKEVLDRGEALILMGDLNRPLYSEKVSPGTKLLLDWIKEDTMEILNDNTPCSN